MGLGDHGVARAIPRQVVAEEEARDPDVGQLGVGGVRVLDQVPGTDAVPADEVADPEAEQAAELLQPPSGEDVVLGGRGRAAVLVLGVLTPDEQWDPHLHRQAHGHGEDRHVLRPGDVADLGESEAVDPSAHDGVRADLDVVHTEGLQVFDVAPTDVGQVVGGGGDAEGVGAELEHADDLEGAVLAPADRDQAVVVGGVGRAVTVEDGLELGPAVVPVDVGPGFEVPTRTADAVLEEDVRLRLGHDATQAVPDHVRPSISGPCGGQQAPLLPSPVRVRS